MRIVRTTPFNSLLDLFAALTLGGIVLSPIAGAMSLFLNYEPLGTTARVLLFPFVLQTVCLVFILALAWPIYLFDKMSSAARFIFNGLVKVVGADRELRPF